MSSSLTPYQWYAAVLRGETTGARSISEEALSQCGLENGVIALARYHLEESSAWEQLPESLRNRFQEHSRQSAAAELVQQHELQQVLPAFKANNITALLMKGTPLAYSLYPQPYLRSRCDTDLLFDTRESADKAWEVIRKMGYQRPNAVSGEFISHEFTCYRSGVAGVHHVLDIHWRVNNAQRFARAFSFEELLEPAIAIEPLGEGALALYPVHALLLACMHRIAHKPEGSENRLIWLYDIHLLCIQFNTEEWKQLISLATEKELCNICLDGLNQTQMMFHTTIPDHVTTALEKGASRESTHEDTWDSRRSMEWSNLRSLPGWRARLAFIKETLFPDAGYMMEKYNTTHRFLLPFLYIQRAYQGFRKRL